LYGFADGGFPFFFVLEKAFRGQRAFRDDRWGRRLGVKAQQGLAHPYGGSVVDAFGGQVFCCFAQGTLREECLDLGLEELVILVCFSFVRATRTAAFP
jgi:hypothetical protein